MDIGQSVAYIFEDDAWPSKVGLGALLGTIPVLSFAAVGYEAQVARNVARGQPRPLPAWDDLGRFFVEGFWLSLARLIYSLPALALLGLPLALIFPLLATAQTEQQVDARLPFVFLVCGMAFVAALFFSLVIGLISPAITAQYVLHGMFAACFDFGAMARFIRENLAPYFTVWAGMVVIGLLVASVIGTVGTFLNFIPCFGALLSWPLFGAGIFITLLAVGHLVGQLLRADEARAAPGKLLPEAAL
ncbi:MAG: DUF4013 domain-containing protein [Anaerolineales bacterium]